MIRPQKAYRINLIRDLRAREMKAEQRQRILNLGAIGCFAMLAMTIAYSAMTIWNMENILGSEKQKMEYLKTEYRKYTETRLTVDKGDVELLTSLQGRGIFWTKKLAAMANHLPDDYSITRLSFKEGALLVSGEGVISPKQDQLLILDAYMRDLRMDTVFADIFFQIQLNKAERSLADDSRFTFEFVALTKHAKARK